MQIPRGVFERMLILMGEDTATFNVPVTNLAMRLFINDFSPNPAMTILNFTEASFGGYGALDVAVGPCPQSNDPATGDSLMDIRPDALSFLWEVTTLTGIPCTVYGYFLTNAAGGQLLAAERFITPVTLTDVNDSVAINRAFLRQISGSVE